MLRGRETVTSGFEDEGMIRCGFAVSRFLLCRASELWTHDGDFCHPAHRLTRNDFKSPEIRYFSTVPGPHRTSRASTSNQKQEVSEMSRTKVKVGTVKLEDWVNAARFGIISRPWHLNPMLPENAPLTNTIVKWYRQRSSRTPATNTLKKIITSIGLVLEPSHFALRSGRIGEATKLAEAGATGTQMYIMGR